MRTGYSSPHSIGKLSGWPGSLYKAHLEPAAEEIGIAGHFGWPHIPAHARDAPQRERRAHPSRGKQTGGESLVSQTVEVWPTLVVTTPLMRVRRETAFGTPSITLESSFSAVLVTP
jgi:hypothetical protein